jgi:repressor LexA
VTATRPRSAPTARDLEVLGYVRAHIARHDCAPTRAEIAEVFGFSRPTAEGHLQALAQHRLVRLHTRWRGIEATRRGAEG